MLVCTQIRRACSNADSDVEKKVWGEVGESVFLTSSQAVLTGLVPGPHHEDLGWSWRGVGVRQEELRFPQKNES